MSEPSTPDPSKRYRQFLLEAGQALAEQSFRNELMPASEAVPYDVLLVVVGDSEHREWQLELSILPNLESSLEGASILQCFAALPVEAASGVETDLLRLLAKLNAKLPLVGFGWLEESRLVYYRHTLMIPQLGDTALGVLIQAAWMISYLLNLFGVRIIEVAAGQRSLEQALDGHPHREIFGF